MINNLLKDKKVAIIGAGPVGLTLARLIQQSGIDVKVYERDKSADSRISGGTLDIHKMTGQKALIKAGILEQYYHTARPTGERGLDTSGNVIMREFPEEANLYDRPEIDRNDLRRLLLESLEQDTVIWGKNFASLQQIDQKFSIHFEDGSTAFSDVVIGANGGRSKVRSYVTDVQPIFTGSFIVQGEVPEPKKRCPGFKALCEEDNLMVMGDNQKFLFSQIKSGGTINYYLAFQTTENFLAKKQLDIHNPSEITSFLKGFCYDWDDRYKELFAATDYFTALPMYKMPLEKKWETSADANITLVGDAAHLMPPFAGIGVNIGLLDALYLAENLTDGNFSTIREALDDYELKMFKYAAEAQTATAEAESGFFSQESVDDQLRGREEWNKKL